MTSESADESTASKIFQCGKVSGQHIVLVFRKRLDQSKSPRVRLQRSLGVVVAERQKRVKLFFFSQVSCPKLCRMCQRRPSKSRQIRLLRAVLQKTLLHKNLGRKLYKARSIVKPRKLGYRPASRHVFLVRMMHCSHALACNSM